jgi:hypothetical protein
MALAGHSIDINGQGANPGTLNKWLRANSGYVGDNDLEESVVPKINKARIEWTGKAFNLSAAEVKKMLDDPTHIVIANVMHGGHFVLVVGYDAGNTNFYTNDPGFNTMFYTMEQIVGWRIFRMK